MENIIKSIKKNEYKRPEISEVKIDNEISLVLMSANPNQGDGSHPFGSIQPEHFKDDPFKAFKV